MAKGPGRNHREGVSFIEMTEMFPDERTAVEWFESVVWPEGRVCPRCGCAETREASKTSGLPYYCTGCRKPFSVRIGTALQKSKVPLRKWAIAIYLETTNLKGISSMQLHRELGVTQRTAWFMLNRIREAWAGEAGEPFEGPAEVDETYLGGKRKNMRKAKRKQLKGRGGAGKSMVVGVKDRRTNQIKAGVSETADRETLQGIVEESTLPDATVYTDDALAYKGMDRKHESVTHSVGEYVNGMAHTNGMESFWAMLKRGYHGVYHKISPKHLPRYVAEYAGRHNMRDMNTIEQMEAVVVRLVGKRLSYKELTS